MIRFNINEDKAIISYLLEPKYHGMGLGQTILTKGLKILQEEYEKGYFSFKNVIGCVKQENIASIKAFERLGFTKSIEGKTLNFIKEVAQ